MASFVNSDPPLVEVDIHLIEPREQREEIIGETIFAAADVVEGTVHRDRARAPRATRQGRDMMFRPMLEQE